MTNAISGFHARSQFKEGQTIRIGTQEGTIESLTQSALFLRIGDELHRIPMAALQQNTVVFLDRPRLKEKPSNHSVANGVSLNGTL